MQRNSHQTTETVNPDSKTRQRLHTALATTALTIAGLYASPAAASGFALMEQSVSGLGRAFAGAGAVADDASTIWFNPAGMTQLKGRQFAMGGHGLQVSAEFTNNGSANNAVIGGNITGGNDDGGENAVIPNVYYAMPINDKAWFGLAINSPFGLSTKYNDGWVGRYHALESSLLSINIQPSLAYKVSDQLSVGGGINIMYADATISNALDQFAICRGIELGVIAVPVGTCAANGIVTANGHDAKIELTGNDTAFGLNLGATYDLSDATRIGASFRSQIQLKVKGDADFSSINAILPTISGGAFVDTGARSDVTLPASFSLSAAHKLNNKTTLLFDWTRTNWSVFKEFRFRFDNAAQSDGVTTEDWQDSNRVAFGMQYRANDQMTYRAGIAYDETPVPSAQRRTARIPDSDRTWLSFGLSYERSDSLGFDVGFTHLFVNQVDINNTLESSVATANATLTGRYKGNVNLLSAQARWTF